MDDIDKLIDVATQDSWHRRLPLIEVADIAEIQASERVLREAFRAEGYNRRVARKKPFLNADKKAKRLTWAQAHQHWTVEDWRHVIWTDESYVRTTGLGGRVWVTRLSTEEYYEDCLVPKFEKKNSVMIWGAICGSNGGTKSPVVIWQRDDWGNINAGTYIKHVVHPILYPYWYECSNMDGIWHMVMEDGAAAHKALLTRQAEEEYGIERLVWAASSPDLNPIETIWRILKQRINSRSPRPTTKEAVAQAIEEEWQSITSEEIVRIIDTMVDRVKAVIAADGGHTRY